MDKQLEERIRQRAYELWVQHGCLPDRSDEYWFQAEREIRDQAGEPSTADMRPDSLNETEFGAVEQGVRSVEREEAATSDSGSLFPPDVAGAPVEEGSPGPVARKTRRKRTETALPSPDEGEPTSAPGKRKRSARTP